MKYLISTALVAMTGAALTSCSDWTDPKSVDVKYGMKEESADYAAYQENLKQYRNSKHTCVYAWVDLSESGPKNQSERLTSLPDSLDVVVVKPVDNIDATTLSDMEKIKSDKGMKVIVDIDLEDYKAQYNVVCTTNQEKRDNLDMEYATKDMDDPQIAAEYESKLAALADPDLADYMSSMVQNSINFANRYPFDGVIFGFDGKSSRFLDEEEMEEYGKIKDLFVRSAMNWYNSNKGKMFEFMGIPKNIENDELANLFQHLFIRETMSAPTSGSYSLIYNDAIYSDGFPAEKLGVMTTYLSSDPEQASVGVLSNGDLMINGMSNWLNANNIPVVGVQNVQNDYFTNISLPYVHIRSLIQAANPKY